MLIWYSPNHERLAREFKQKLHPRLRAAILELENYVHRSMRKDVEVLNIHRTPEEEKDFKGEVKSTNKHMWADEIMAIDLANRYSDSELGDIEEHLRKIGTMFVPLVRKDLRGEYLHVEIPMPGLERRTDHVGTHQSVEGDRGDRQGQKGK